MLRYVGKDKKIAGFEPDDFYTNDCGLIIFTEKDLLKRGLCFNKVCKHCPYGNKK